MENKRKETQASGGRYLALRQDEAELEGQKHATSPAQPAVSDVDEEIDDGEDVGLLDDSFYARTTRHCSATRRHTLFLEFAVLGLVLIIALFGALIWTRHSDHRHHVDTAAGGSEGSHPGSRGKYVLDPDWDFDAAPQTREYHWNVRDVELRPDGVKRPMITIDGEFPGPMIECNEGDTIVVEVRNRAVNATSFHWHGIYQNGSTFMDGTVGISQCPIAPGYNMTYRFTVDNQSGTYWYHAHMAMQGSDGLFGPLIVHSKKEKQLQQLEYASDQVIMVQDHYHDLTSALLPQYLAPDNENAEPVPDGGLINGMNKRNCDTLQNRDCESTNTELATFGLEANKNHRLRIINTGAFAEFQVKIDEHMFAVTEVDGTDVIPAYYHRLDINPGQRYSIVINTNVTDKDTFWLRAKMITACFAEDNENLEPEVRAIIQYTSTDTPIAPATPSSTDWDDVVSMQCLDMNTTELAPVESITPPPADTTIYLRANFEIGSWRLSRGFFNGSSWRPPLSSPSLHRMAAGYASRNASFLPAAPHAVNAAAFDASTELVYQTSGIRVLDILVSNFDDGNHPLHLHGHKYSVLASGHGYPPAAPLLAATTVTNPLRRDTAGVEAFGWILLRLVADNPGAWAFHCHIGWHAEAGMLMQFATRVDLLAQDLSIPAAQLALCRADGLGRGAAPPDSTWFGDFGGAFRDAD